jgi:hypothetical protein|tara:strand:- start:2676 stop:2861 length:186 start_codon:yes stop_codon:yes gene_type:complete
MRPRSDGWVDGCFFFASILAPSLASRASRRRSRAPIDPMSSGFSLTRRRGDRPTDDDARMD